MRVKTPAKVTGIPSAEVNVSPGSDDDGRRQVTMLVKAICYDQSKVVCSLRLSPEEALHLAERLRLAVTCSLPDPKALFNVLGSDPSLGHDR